MNIPVQARSIRNTLLFGYRTITLFLATFGLVFGIGFMLLPIDDDRYYPFIVLFDPIYWAIIFCVYGLLKIYQARSFCSTRLRIINSIIGMWLWAYVSISLIVYDPKSINPAELLLFLPLIYEIVELIIDLFQHKNLKRAERVAK